MNVSARKNHLGSYVRKVHFLFLGMTLIALGLACKGSKNPLPPDIDPPNVSIVTPVDGSTVFEKTTIRALATDNTGIKSLELWVDGILEPGSADTTEPYEFLWDTTIYPDNSLHSISVRAFDTSDNTVDSNPITLNVDNSGARPARIEISQVVFKTNAFTITWRASEDADFGSYSLFQGLTEDLSDASLIFNSTDRNDTLYTVSGVSENETRYYRLTVRDTFGLEASSSIASGRSFSFALDFDGTDDIVFVESIDPAVDEISNQITLESWIYLRSIPDPAAYVVSRSDLIAGPPNGDRYLLAILPGNSAHLNINGFALAAGLVTQEKWVHVAGTYNGQTMRIYVNGTLRGEQSASTLINVRQADILIGNFDVIQRRFDGLIDEVRIWNIARTQDEIMSTMNTRLSGAESGLVAYWPLENGSGQRVLDSVGNSNGTLGASESVESSDPNWAPVNFPHNN